MQKILALVYFLFAFCSIASAQSSKITGTVITSDNIPAQYVSLVIKGGKQAAVSDAKGNFVFEKLASGKYEILASLVGFDAETKEVELSDNQTVTVNFQLKVSGKELKEVIVNANRKSYISERPSTSLRINADLIEVPQNITVATRQSLVDMGLISKTEIFRLSSGITKSYGSAMDMTVQIRGTNATFSTYRNGIGGPVWWNAQEDAAMVERLEFVKGPSGFMLSNAEPGGLINTVTKQPTHQRIAEFGFGIGSWNMMRTNIDLGGEVSKNGKLTYRLNTGVQRNNEFYEFGKFDRVFIAPALKYEFSDKTSLTYEFNFVQAHAQENVHSSVSINGDLWAVPTDLAINDPNNRPWLAVDRTHRLYLKHEFDPDWTLNVQAGYMTTDWDGKTFYIENLSPGKDTINRYLSSNDWNGLMVNGQIYLDGRFNTGHKAEHKVLLGIDYGIGNEGSTYADTWGIQNFPLSINSPTYYLPKDELVVTGDPYSWVTTNRWQAIYLQDHLKLFNKLILTIAGRYTHLVSGQDYNSPDDPDYEAAFDKFTPRLGLTYMFTKNISAYILHDESFLPQRGRMYDGGRMPPLTGRNNEVGVKALFFDSRLSITASAYDIIKNDVANTDPQHPGFYLKTGQIGAKGVELDISGQLAKGLYVNMNYSYVDAKITKDEDKSLVGLQNNGTAKNLANLWAKYQVSNGILKGLGFGGGVQYTDKRSATWPGYSSMDGNKYLPSSTIFDATLSYNIGRISIFLNVYNLANTKYATSGSWQPDYQEYLFDIEPGRNFRLQTNIRL